jgi:uncharacterized MAPEG superfamily protein
VTIELTMLAYSVALLFVLVMVQAVAGILAQGLLVMAGPRDELPPPTRFQARAGRVVDNHREGLTMFAPLVLAAALLDVNTAWTVLGAQLFFYGRVVHAVLYLAAVPLVRPVAWFVGIVGTALMFVELIAAL